MVSMPVDGVVREGHRTTPVIARETLDEGAWPATRVAVPVAQGRDVDHDLGEAVVKVFPETAGLDQALHVLVGGADDAHIHGIPSRPPMRSITRSLQEAQQLWFAAALADRRFLCRGTAPFVGHFHPC